MKIEALRIKNFKAFKAVTMQEIPAFCVIVGANGTGKSTLFNLFGFLQEALTTNVTTALIKQGGSRGFKEVRSRNCEGPIEIELTFREPVSGSLVTYFLQINEGVEGQAVVEREILKYQSRTLLDFANGKGIVDSGEDERALDKKQQEELKSADILAIKGLAQFTRFPIMRILGDFIESWHISDIQISKARQPGQGGSYAPHLSREGDNLPLVLQHLCQSHPDIFQRILHSMERRIPGITRIEAKIEGERVLLKFQDGAFADPFLARDVSDGTIVMLAYLTLLYDQFAHPLLCVEEPENQLYPRLLEELAEDFRDYSNRKGETRTIMPLDNRLQSVAWPRETQVLVSTHSPDFLNAIQLEEVFWLVKKQGYTEIKRASQDAQVSAYMQAGDKMGYLWKQGFFEGVDPE